MNVYTVAQLAKLAGVSVRTVHYYDQIGLLEQSHIQGNGYRLYEHKQLLQLQQILFFKEMDFPLEEIKTIIQSPHFNTIEALQKHKKMIQAEKERLERILVTISKTMKHMKNDTKIKDEELYGGLTKQQMEEYDKEAQERWGHTEAYKQSKERTKNWTKSDYDRVAKEGGDITVAVIWTKV